MFYANLEEFLLMLVLG